MKKVDGCLFTVEGEQDLHCSEWHNLSPPMRLYSDSHIFFLDDAHKLAIQIPRWHVEVEKLPPHSHFILTNTEPQEFKLGGGSRFKEFGLCKLSVDESADFSTNIAFTTQTECFLTGQAILIKSLNNCFGWTLLSFSAVNRCRRWKRQPKIDPDSHE